MTQRQVNVMPLAQLDATFAFMAKEGFELAQPVFFAPMLPAVSDPHNQIWCVCVFEKRDAT